MSAPPPRSSPRSSRPSFLRPSARAFALIVLLIAACILGLAPILVRLTETGPAAAGFWRFLFALPLLTVLAAREPGGIATPSKWALLAGLFFALDLSFWHYGIVMTSVANATVLCNLTPVVVTLFGWVVLKERPRRLFLVALALAMGGALAMAAGADGGQGTNPPLGDAFSLSVAVWYSGYFLAVKAARATAGAMRITFWATLLGAPLLLIVALALGEDIAPASLAGWGAAPLPAREALTIPAQVNYVGKGTDIYAAGYTFHGSAQVIVRYLRTAYLWDRVRVQGGAYGAFCSFDRLSGVLSFVSYRDPNIASTLATYDQAADFLLTRTIDGDELTKSIVGAIGDIDAYMLPDAKGFVSLARHLWGETDEDRQRLRDEVLSTGPGHFRGFAQALKAVADKGDIVILGSADSIDQAAAAMAGLTKTRVL